ncbi:unnamed protein product [Lampetra fluviatilis]
MPLQQPQLLELPLLGTTVMNEGRRVPASPHAGGAPGGDKGPVAGPLLQGNDGAACGGHVRDGLGREGRLGEILPAGHRSHATPPNEPPRQDGWRAIDGARRTALLFRVPKQQQQHHHHHQRQQKCLQLDANVQGLSIHQGVLQESNLHPLQHQRAANALPLVPRRYPPRIGLHGSDSTPDEASRAAWRTLAKARLELPSERSLELPSLITTQALRLLRFRDLPNEIGRSGA